LSKRLVKVYFSPPIMKVLEVEAERTGMSMSGLLRQAYMTHIKQHNLYTELVHNTNPGENEG